MAAVLVITTHGDVQVRKSKKMNMTEDVVTFEIPEDMNIVALEAVPPSIPNLLPPKNVAPFVKIIKEEIIEWQ